jgi:hypothetical protein
VPAVRRPSEVFINLSANEPRPARSLMNNPD